MSGSTGPIAALGAGLYGAITSGRNLLFDRMYFGSYRSRLPVICVGNITTGGTGKTPLVQYLSRMLVRQGQQPVILSRGYGGRRHGPWLVGESDTFADVGDEPLMLSREAGAAVVIARSRVIGARFIEERGLGTVIILDDGYQHRWLDRDLNIVCVNADGERALDQFIAGKLLPAGNFREARAAALRRASLVVLSSRSTAQVDWESSRVRRVCELIPPHVPVISTHLSKAEVRSADGKILKPQRVTALCAIANPAGFFTSLSNLGFTDRADTVFPDHSPRIIEACRHMLKETNAPIVMTEKDAVRLPVELNANPRVCVLHSELEVDNQTKFAEIIDGVLRRYQ